MILTMNILRLCLLALGARLVLIAYGEWQDRTMLVKYTDVDYYVFSDAAQYVTNGQSPYNRATYRYTPLLAWMLTPNIYISPVFGKLLFVLSDVIAGYLMHQILLLRGVDAKTSKMCASVWLFNPLPMGVSSRGNAEALTIMLVLGTLYFVMTKCTNTAAFLYATAVHFRIYPATYALPLFLLMDEDYTGCTCNRKQATKTMSDFIGIFVNPSRVQLVFTSAMTFVLLTGLCFVMYGQEFVEETYLYHLTRRDIRHNFSVYFYMLYLTSESEWSIVMGIVTFLPQVVLLVAVSCWLYRDLPFCCFVQTFLFVTFNKVCTSQYFLWYLSLLPVILPTLKMKIQDAVTMATLWFLGQALWLLPAYYLEFQGQNTFLYIWAAGILFFAINVWILIKLLNAHVHEPMFSKGKLVKLNMND
ncbi:PIGM [Branchiostoma lanceolatum]|uniref:GPI alpha-1,4-mannosyltransferase I, catalytic subunit n=1 Tax=Branchiostoma lanceolatum TaxID=7740 RepID=A0A8J9VYA8_BRALA|nr:PIGM [Branchiostoma lanceolatum]